MTHLECPQCRRKHSLEASATFCVCGSPLFARYDLARTRESVGKDEFPTAVNSMWRYSQLLPVKSPSCIFSLGEGWTPLITSKRLGTHLGMKLLRIKDEGQNPTSSFKDRGLCAAVSKHLELGSETFAIPSAGNAAVSTSAYSAAAGKKAYIFMPKDTPEAFFTECELFGAEVFRVDGNISDAGREMASRGEDWTVLSTTKEPYRVEGKKTLGYEICEQLGWDLPDAIVCPTGGGTAVIGIWKAFEELESIGLIGRERPRMYAIQSEGCAPIVAAHEKSLENVEPWKDGETEALGLRVPRPFAGRLILQALRNSGGGAIAVAEQEISSTRRMVGRMEGMDICPEAAVGIAGLRNLIEAGLVDYDEEVILLNTGSGSRYTNVR
ncbi:threonine synthase [Candidatus Thorarchaeota archaeon]|nr:MAG: threonine synthase [Candidatus Thorarchaeota archaeon]